MVINGRGQTALFTAAKRPSRTISGKGAREESNRTGTTTYRARVSLGKRDRSAPPPSPPFRSRARRNRFYRGNPTDNLARKDVGKSTMQRTLVRALCHNDSINIEVSVGHLVSFR